MTRRESFSFHTSWNSNQKIAFVVPDHPPFEAYVDATWGILIQSVIADGNNIDIFDYDIDLDDVNFRKVRYGSGIFLYHYLFSRIIFASELEANGEFKLKYCDAPAAAETIQFDYKPRIAAGVYGAECRLVSMKAD